MAIDKIRRIFRRSEVVACEKASEWAKALQLFPGDATTPRRHGMGSELFYFRMLQR